MIKKLLLLIPLITLCSCVNQTKKYENVEFYFDFDSKLYVVEVESTNKTYKLGAENVFYVQTYEYRFNDDREIIFNEFYINPNKLYIYLKR